MGENHPYCRRSIFVAIFCLLLCQNAVVFGSIWSFNRFHRDAINGQNVNGVNIEWLTDQQLSELGHASDVPARMDKLRQYFDAMESGPAKEQAQRKIVAKCYDWVKEVASEQEQQEWERVHHQDHGKCKQKVRELLVRLEKGSERREQVESRLPFCEHVWYSTHQGGEGEGGGDHHQHHHHQHADDDQQQQQQQQQQQEQHHAAKRWAHRHPRNDNGDQHQHTLENYLQTHLSWLTDEQKEQMRAAKDQGKAALQAKAMEFFEQSTGEQRERAITQLQNGCRELLKKIFGEEKAAELKQLKEGGASVEEMATKINELTEGLDDEGKKARVREYGPACKKIFMLSAGAGSSRRRREEGGEQQVEHEGHAGGHGQHSIEDYFRTHLSWLTDAQKEELKQLKGEGKSRAELQHKVLEWYDASEGETKQKATELLRGGCKELVKMVFGEEKTNKLKEMKVSGTEEEKFKSQMEQWISELQDEHKKQLIEAYRPMCAKVFESAKKAVASRRRRDHHEGHTGDHGQHSIEDYFRTHLSWLTNAQKEELKQLKGEGKSRAELQQKVLEWYDASEGETKQKATELLQGGCKELVRMVLGEEKANKLKEMRESGTNPEKLKEQALQWISEIQDEHKKQNAELYKPMCDKVFKVAKASRRRRDGDDDNNEHNIEETMEDHFDTHLRWLSGQQTEKLKQMMNSRDGMHQKVLEWFRELEGEKREKVAEIVKKGCRDLSNVVLGEAKVAEVMRMKQAGVSTKAVSAKIDEWIDNMEEGWRKTVAHEHKAICHEVYKPAKRSRRSNRQRHRYQQEEEEEEEGNNESESGQQRQRYEMKQQRHKWNGEAEEDGQEGDEVQLEEGERQQRRQRGRNYNNNNNNNNQENNNGEDAEGNGNYGLGDNHNLDRHHSWLNSKQKKLLKQMRDRGHRDHELHDKIHQFYQVSPDEVKATAKGILQKGCEAILQRLFGDYKAEEIIQMREDGASNAEVDAKIDEALTLIRNPQKREEAARFALTCRRIFAMIERRRREVAPAEKTLNELFKSHLSWLSEDQKAELKQYQDQGASRTELQQKVLAWFEQLEGQPRVGALEHMRDGCRELLASVIGGENAEELKRLKESGATEEQLEAKAQELIGAVQDEQKKAKAREFGPTCKKIFKAT